MIVTRFEFSIFPRSKFHVPDPLLVGVYCIRPIFFLKSSIPDIFTSQCVCRALLMRHVFRLLGLDFPVQKLHLEVEVRILWYLWRSSLVTISIMRRTSQNCSLTPLHGRDANIPSSYHLPIPNLKREWLVTKPTRIKFSSIINQCPHIVDRDHAAWWWQLFASALLEYLLQEPAIVLLRNVNESIFSSRSALPLSRLRIHLHAAGLNVAAWKGHRGDAGGTKGLGS
mmetsp:Transcript_43988/g.81721  ORF Transcript_43988/g.81721 Transcript_43988/m.81721 type:complete len:226 (-) Transcript_43988:9-686(-)